MSRAEAWDDMMWSFACLDADALEGRVDARLVAGLMELAWQAYTAQYLAPDGSPVRA